MWSHPVMICHKGVPGSQVMYRCLRTSLAIAHHFKVSSCLSSHLPLFKGKCDAFLLQNDAFPIFVTKKTFSCRHVEYEIFVQPLGVQDFDYATSTTEALRFHSPILQRSQMEMSCFTTSGFFGTPEKSQKKNDM